MFIDLVIRQKTGALVQKIMGDYESEIEDAYCQVEEGEFSVNLKAKYKQKGDATVVKVEMSFDPQKKVKDTVSETVDRKQKPLPMGDKQADTNNVTPMKKEGKDDATKQY